MTKEADNLAEILENAEAEKTDRYRRWRIRQNCAEYNICPQCAQKNTIKRVESPTRLPRYRWEKRKYPNGVPIYRNYEKCECGYWRSWRHTGPSECSSGHWYILTDSMRKEEGW